jgi:chemotaxis protein CheZ
MPYAVDKLQFVIAETEAAANKTTDVVEKYFQSLESFGDHLKMVDGPAESIRYFQAFQSELENDLTTILTTQQFQDLTGQTIRKVMAVVADIENELVKLVTTFGDAPLDLIPAAISAPAEAPETVSQSDVDDLLKELGF